ncbi:hypothetical protein SAMN05421858_0626 [Haladaptatus litoreus]|uniref:Uncharacterized protein n=1 Tax=Haladaptatus litoreus TaxID=553468 RepID=A0A1N6W7R6_9EURY|nr:hypothetical protein SAMN05421858_0626 [Haladaptatus litoreus]
MENEQINGCWFFPRVFLRQPGVCTNCYSVVAVFPLEGFVKPSIFCGFHGSFFGKYGLRATYFPNSQFVLYFGFTLIGNVYGMITISPPQPVVKPDTTG